MYRKSYALGLTLAFCLLAGFASFRTPQAQNFPSVGSGGTCSSGCIIFPSGSGQVISRPTSQVFTGSGTFTLPTGVTGVKVTVIAGGGGGGGSTVTNTGTGGGSGGASIKWLTGLTPGNTLAVTVGGGGSGNSGAAGSNGIASSVASGTQTITTITTNPGFGGGSGVPPLAGQIGGSAGSGGDINFGGGGSSDAATGVASAGGGSLYGGGGASGGNPGSAYGSGGGGARIGATTAGGVGQQGIVIFEWNN